MMNEYDGCVVKCPECGSRIIIEDKIADCSCCGWYREGGYVEEIEVKCELCGSWEFLSDMDHIGWEEKDYHICKNHLGTDYTMEDIEQALIEYHSDDYRPEEFEQHLNNIKNQQYDDIADIDIITDLYKRKTLSEEK